MQDCDLAFEHSTVDVQIDGEILSVKNPIGTIVATRIGEVIFDQFKRGEAVIKTK